MNTHCALCQAELTKANRTKEHIIPNSIGGLVKIEGFICRSCNSETGKTWDAQLADDFNWLSLMIGIERDRNEVPSVLVETISGDEYRLLNDGSMQPVRPTFSKIEEEGKKISLTARTMTEAIRQINSISKAYPKFDKAQALAQAQMKTSYLKEPLKMEFTFGGSASGRSVVKSSLAFACWRGISSPACENVREFLWSKPKVDEDGNEIDIGTYCYGMSYLTDIVKCRSKGAIFHAIGIHGDPDSRSLLAYVEFFGLARWLIVLSKNYEGPCITETYAIDPTSGKQVEIDLDWTISSLEIKRIVDGDGLDNYLAALDPVMERVMERANERAMNNAIVSAYKNAYQNQGLQPGAPLTESQAAQMAKEISNALTAYLVHRMGLEQVNLGENK